MVVVKAKNLIWTNDKTTAGKALLAGWLLHVAGGSCDPAARPRAAGGVSRCGASYQAPPPPALAELRSQELRSSGWWGRWESESRCLGCWEETTVDRHPLPRTRIHDRSSTPRNWTVSQIPHGGQGHQDGVGARQDLMPLVYRSRTRNQGLGERPSGSLGGSMVQAGTARTPSAGRVTSREGLIISESGSTERAQGDSGLTSVLIIE